MSGPLVATVPSAEGARRGLASFEDASVLRVGLLRPCAHPQSRIRDIATAIRNILYTSLRIRSYYIVQIALESFHHGANTYFVLRENDSLELRDGQSPAPRISHNTGKLRRLAMLRRLSPTLPPGRPSVRRIPWLFATSRTSGPPSTAIAAPTWHPHPPNSRKAHPSATQLEAGVSVPRRR